MAGFASGLVSGLQASNELQMQGLLRQEAGEKLTMNAQQIELTQRTLDQQKQFMKIMQHKLAQLNSGGASGSISQADMLAQLADASAEANFASGRVEEGISDAMKASNLRSNQAYMQEVQSKVRAEKSDYSAGLLSWVLDAPDDQEAARRWNSMNISFQLRYGEKSRAAGQPYSRQLAQDLYAQTQTVSQRAAEDLKKAQKDKATADLKRIDIENKKDIAETALADQRRADLIKSGGLTKAQQRQQEASEEAKETALTDIESLRAMIKSDPAVVGVKGLISSALETGKTILHIGDQDTPEARFSTQLHGFILHLQQAMRVPGGRQLKAVYEQINDMANLLRKGTTDKIALAKLDVIEGMLKGQITAGKRRGAINRVTKHYKSASEVKSDFEAGKIDQDSAIEILENQFGMGE